MAEIGKEEGIKGYWKGNLPQVLDITHLANYDFVSHAWFILCSHADLFLLHKLLQVIRIIPYSAVQLFSYEVYKVITSPCY